VRTSKKLGLINGIDLCPLTFCPHHSYKSSKPVNKKFRKEKLQNTSKTRTYLVEESKVCREQCNTQLSHT